MARVQAERIASYTRSDWEGDEVTAFYRCTGCSAPILTRSRTGDEGWRHAERQIYPKRPEIAQVVPAPIAQSIREAHRCHEAGAYIACVVMCRRVLEALCAHLLPKAGGTLATRIEHLHKAGHLDVRMLEWATALREDGNLAAHETEYAFNKHESRALLDFSESIIEQVLVTTSKFEAFKQQRAQRKARPEVAKAPDET